MLMMGAGGEGVTLGCFKLISFFKEKKKKVILDAATSNARGICLLLPKPLNVVAAAAVFKEPTIFHRAETGR